MVRKKFPGGTFVKINGMPFALFSDTYLVGHDNNFKIAAGDEEPIKTLLGESGVITESKSDYDAGASKLYDAITMLHRSGYEWRIEKQGESYQCVLWKDEWITSNLYASRPMPAYLGCSIVDAILGVLRQVGIIYVRFE